MSKLEQRINEADEGILSNETTIRIFKTFNPPSISTFAITCNLENAIEKGSVISSPYITNGKTYVLTDFIEGVDSGSGKMYQVERSINSTTVNYSEVGTVDYSTGIINIIPLIYFNVEGGLKIYATSQTKDVYCYKNTIIGIDTVSGLHFNVVKE